MSRANRSTNEEVSSKSSPRITPEGAMSENPKPIWKRPIVSNDVDLHKVNQILSDLLACNYTTAALSNEPESATVHARKYKAVDKRIRPVPAVMPEDAKVRRTFPEDPLKNLPVLSMNPPEFVPTSKITQERMDSLGIDNNPDMTMVEKRLLKHLIVLNERSIAFEDNERGTFRRDYFSDYQIPVIEHVPWVDKNIPLPPGHREEIIRILKERIEAGVYEKAQSSYRSRWFCVGKKNGGVWLVHDLQKLNGVTIRDTGVPPILEEFVEAYAGRSVYSVLDTQGAKPCILDQKTVQKLFRKEQKIVPFSCLRLFNWNLKNCLLFVYSKNSTESIKSCIQFSITFSTLQLKIYDTIFCTLNIKWKKK